MSYHKDLDEYSESDLKHELDRRALIREQGLCDYCNQAGDTNPCKFPDRHQIAVNYMEHEKARGGYPSGCGVPTNGLPCTFCGGAIRHSPNCPSLKRIK